MESLTDVAVFVRVVDTGSFTMAAEQLKLSKSVVSKYVTRLENRLGARLLNRTTRRLSLTEAGQVFYERSRKALTQIDEAEAEVLHLQGEPRGTLRLNTPMSFGIGHIAPVLADYAKQYPHVVIDMNLDDRKVDVIEEGFDVSVRISDLPDSSLVARRLGPCRHVIAAAPAYLRRRAPPKTPDDLVDHGIVAYRYQASALNWQFEDAAGVTTAVELKSSLTMNNSLALRAALLGGIGIARMPTFVVGEDIREGRLMRLLEGYRLPEVSIYLVYPQRRHMSPKVQSFVDFMAERIKDPPYWD